MRSSQIRDTRKSDFGRTPNMVEILADTEGECEVVNIGSNEKISVDETKDSAELFKLIEQQCWAQAVSHLRDNPREASVWSFADGYDSDNAHYRLPIHEACRRCPPKDVIVRLIDAYPDGAKKRDVNGRLPMHHACIWGASYDVIRLLLSAYPNSIDAKDKWGNSPVDALEATDHPDKLLLEALGKEDTPAGTSKLHQSPLHHIPPHPSSVSRNFAGSATLTRGLRSMSPGEITSREDARTPSMPPHLIGASSPALLSKPSRFSFNETERKESIVPRIGKDRTNPLQQRFIDLRNEVETEKSTFKIMEERDGLKAKCIDLQREVAKVETIEKRHIEETEILEAKCNQLELELMQLETLRAKDNAEKEAMADELARLREGMSSLETNAKHEKEIFEAKFLLMESETAQVDAKERILQDENEILLAKCDEMQKKISDLGTLLTKEEFSKKAMQIEVKSLEQKCEERSKLYNKIAGAEAKERSACDHAEREILEAKCDHMQKEIAHFGSLLAKEEVERRTFQDAVKDLEAKCGVLQMNVLDFQSREQVLNKEKEALHGEVARLNQRVLDYDANEAKWESMVNDSNEYIAEVKAQLSNEKLARLTMSQNLHKENEDLKGELDELRAKHKSSTDEIAKLKEEIFLEGAERALDQAAQDQEKLLLEQELAQAKEIADGISEKEQMMSEMQAKIEELTRQSETCAQLRKQLGEEQGKNAALQALQSGMEEMRTELEQERSKNAALEEQCSDKEHSIVDVQAEISLLRTELQEAARNKEKISQLKDELEEILSKNAALDKELEKTRKNSVDTSIVESLNSKISVLQIKVDWMEPRLSEGSKTIYKMKTFAAEETPLVVSEPRSASAFSVVAPRPVKFTSSSFSRSFSQTSSTCTGPEEDHVISDKMNKLQVGALHQPEDEIPTDENRCPPNGRPDSAIESKFLQWLGDRE